MFTNCVSPPELDDKQLLAYLDNPEATPETGSHLARCPHCYERAEALRRLQQRLTKQLYRITCPSPMELGEYHLHMLPASQMLLVRQHLSECPHCSHEIAQLQEFLGSETQAREGSLLGKAKVLIARLLGDNEQRGPSGAIALPALRGQAKAPLMFEADSILITLDFQTRKEGQISILGQVAADDQDQWTGATAKMQQAGTVPATVSLDDLGAFHYEGVQPGSIEITITSLHDIEVQIPAVEINI